VLFSIGLEFGEDDIDMTDPLRKRENKAASGCEPFRGLFLGGARPCVPEMSGLDDEAQLGRFDLPLAN
jgi:hypothetical protein